MELNEILYHFIPPQYGGRACHAVFFWPRSVPSFGNILDVLYGFYLIYLIGGGGSNASSCFSVVVGFVNPSFYNFICS